MFFITSIFILTVIYIASFSNEFKKEEFEKLAPILIVIGLLAIIINL